MAEERLQKFLASAGVASRRKAEELILAGRVKVNERVVTELGTKVEAGKDLVTLDGRLVSRSEERSYYLLYKPAGCVTTASDPEGRPTAYDYLRGVPERVFPVGRLDYDAEGAILFTDDGELANRLAHPRYGHRRVYLVKVRGDPDPSALARMVSGVRLEDGPAKALEVAVHERVEKNVWIRVVVGEGRYHLVKRLCESVGLFVQRLFRPEFGGVTVEGLRPGQFRPLTAAELKEMRAAVGLETSGRPGEAGAPRPLPRALPRAARRHGHGPPAPPERGEQRADRGERRDARGEERTARADAARGERERDGRADRREDATGGERGDRAERGGRATGRGDAVRQERARPGGRGDVRGRQEDRGGREARGEDRGRRREQPGSGGRWSKPGARSEKARGDAPKGRSEGPRTRADEAKPSRGFAPGERRREGPRAESRDERRRGPPRHRGR